MLRLTSVAVLLAAPLLGGCATIVKGTDQKVSVSTEPQGARCELQRDGKLLTVVDPTPKTVEITKSKSDIEITCTRDGHETARQVLTSEVAAMTVGNVLLGGVVGVAVDAGSGAMHKYDSNVTVRMVPQAAAAPAPVPGS